MLNILIVDGASNATFSVFQATDAEFATLFPADRQDIAFIEDIIEQHGEAKVASLLALVWERPILRRDAQGIHGLLIYDGEERRPHYPQSLREIDWDDASINDAQRRLFGDQRSD